MGILGHTIKGTIQLADTFSTDSNPVESQRKILRDLLETAKNTIFGETYHFKNILDHVDVEQQFSNRVPFHDYHKMHNEWWYKIHDGETHVTWPGEPHYFALSSGTTGKESKRIPVTEEMLKAIRKSGIKQVLSLNNFDLSAEFFEKDILMLGSSTNLNERVDQKLEGEISGISASNIPFWFRPYYKPGKEIAEIEHWDTRIKHIVDNAKNWDVGALSGIPSWIELMLEAVIDHYKLNHIHEIWPNLSVYTSGGVAFGPYKKSFEDLMGQDVIVIDTYLASEGYIATQVRPETDAMQLNTNHGIYFEFVPFKAEYLNEDGSLKQDAPSISLQDVAPETDYVLIISTVSGAWRYIIGDTIEFTDVEKAEIRITGRTKFFLNTVGSQLSVNKMDSAMRFLEDHFDTKIKEYTISAVRNSSGDFIHHWYLGTMLNEPSRNVAQALDQHLMDANKNYKVARGKALNDVKVSLVNPELFYEWNANNKKKGGQVKMERVMDEDKFEQWQSFVSAHK